MWWWLQSQSEGTRGHPAAGPVTFQCWTQRSRHSRQGVGGAAVGGGGRGSVVVRGRVVWRGTALGRGLMLPSVHHRKPSQGLEYDPQVG